MMVLDPSSDVVRNKEATTIATTEPKLDSVIDKKNKTERNSSGSSKSGSTKPKKSPTTATATTTTTLTGGKPSVVSDSLKKSMAKELKVPPPGARRRSSSPGSSSNKSVAAVTKKTTKEKKKTKRVVSDTSLSEKSRTAATRHVRRSHSGSSSTAKKAPARSNSGKALVKKKKKRPIDSTSTSAAADGPRKSSSDDEGAPQRATRAAHSSSRARPLSPTSGKTRKEISFESIHGKSIHKPKTRRNRGSKGSEKQATLSADESPAGSAKKKSALKAKRDKQKQQKQQQDRQKPKQKTANRDSSMSAAQKKREDYIHEVLEIVSNQKQEDTPENENDNGYDSSSSGSCSVVSDGSYVIPDSARTLDTHETVDKESDSSIESAFAMDDGEHPVKPSSPRKNNSPSKNNSPTGKDLLVKKKSLEDLADTVAAFSEQIEEDESTPVFTPSSSAMAKQPRRASLKTIQSNSFKVEKTTGATKRSVPGRSKSDCVSATPGVVSLLRVRLPGQKKPITRQRFIEFNEKVRVKRIPCQAQICGGDGSELWFQPAEYDAIKRKTMALIRAVQDDQTGGVTYCTRGLERYFSIEAVQEKRNDAWDTVLDEQDFQRDKGIGYDSDRLSKAYASCTRVSSMEAAERGKLDEDSIARYIRKTRHMLRRANGAPKTK